MEKRTLGRTGLEVSAIGLGGIKFDGISEEAVAELVNRAIDKGINLIDTARVYDHSERRIGEALKGRRDEVILSSKTQALSADEMRREIEASLRDLQTDYIDIYKTHNLRLPDDYDRATASGGALEALEKARDEGLIRHIGISCHRYHDTLERAILSGRFDLIMVAYNVLNDELMDERIMPLAKEHGLGTLIMKPLGGGVLGAPPEALQIEDASGGARALTVADAIGFVLASPHVDCAVVGMTSVEELEQDVAAAEQAAQFTPERAAALTEAAEAFGKDFCRGCGYCLPCPEGIIIPVILRHLFYFKTYGLEEWAKGRYRMVEVKADNCVACEECMEKCPYDLKIPELLEEAHELLS